MFPSRSDFEGRRRPVVLVFAVFYLPGYKGGGSIRSIANLVEALKDEFDFRIVTADRDLGDCSPYPGIQVNAWQEVAGARVFYLAPSLLRSWRVFRILLAADFDLIYLNSFFSRSFSMLPIFLRRMGIARRIPLLLAPRGEFSPGALAIKPFRKRCFIALQKHLRLFTDNFWHASTQLEELDIFHAIVGSSQTTGIKQGCQIKIKVARNLASVLPDPANMCKSRDRKIPGKLDVVFVSRISRKKNLNVALEILAGVRGEVRFNIYGPIEDTAYWEECQRLIRKLPSNVRVNYLGNLPYTQVRDVFRAHHLFLFPTAGENFGHVIAEALMAGCPVLISDQTPWRQLREKGVGWDLPLKDVSQFQQTIQQCVGMNNEAFQKISKDAAVFGKEEASNANVVVFNRTMFWELLIPHAAAPVPKEQAVK